MDSLLDYDSDLLAPPWGPLGRDMVLGMVASASKLLLNVLNTTVTHNHETYTTLVHDRPPGVGLLTISNHTSTFDDPGLPCALLPLSFFWTEHTHHKNRWTMCAADICFTNELFKQFFLNGKVLPVERGGGVNQGSISVAARALAGGDWLHVFPEGRVTPDGRVGPFRQGIGKLLCEARGASGRDPVILPYYHSGMSRVMPFKASLPRVGHTVEVAVGPPLDLGHITCRCNVPGEDQQAVWRDLAAALQQAVAALQDQVPPNPNQLNRPDVAEHEARYQARVRRRREQQQQPGGADGRGGEPMFMQGLGQQGQQGQGDDDFVGDGDGDGGQQQAEKEGVAHGHAPQQGSHGAPGGLMGIVWRGGRRQQVMLMEGQQEPGGQQQQQQQQPAGLPPEPAPLAPVEQQGPGAAVLGRPSGWGLAWLLDAWTTVVAGPGCSSK